MDFEGNRNLKHVSVKSHSLRYSSSVATTVTALWLSVRCFHLRSHTKVICLICKERSSAFCRLLQIYIFSHMSPWKFSDEHSEVSVLTMHECHTLFPMHRCQWFSSCHYHKLWFIGIVARLQRYMITQSSGTLYSNPHNQRLPQEAILLEMFWCLVLFQCTLHLKSGGGRSACHFSYHLLIYFERLLMFTSVWEFP